MPGEPPRSDRTRKTQQEKPAPLSPGGAHTRRQLMKAGAGLGLLGVVGYLFIQSRNEETAAGGSLLGTVPDDVDFIVHGNGGRLLSDERFQTAVDEQLQATVVEQLQIPVDESLTSESDTHDSPDTETVGQDSPDTETMGQDSSDADTVRGLFDAIERRTAIDPRDTGDVTAFGAAGDEASNYAAIRFESNADPQAVAQRLGDQNVLLDTVEYRGYELWIVGHRNFIWDLVLSHLDGDEFVLGTRPEVEDTIDLQEDGTGGITGDVRQAFSTAADGFLRGGFVVPDSLLESLDLPIIGEQFADRIEYGYGTVAEEPAGELQLTLQTTSSSAAEDVEQTVNALSLIDTETIASVVDLDPEIMDLMTAVLEDISVETEGPAVEIRVPDGFRIAAIAVSYLLAESRG